MKIARRSSAASGGCLLGLALVFCAAAAGASGYRDRVGDVKGGAGPDIASVRVSHTRAAGSFRVRFAAAPPLAVSGEQGWIDMLLIGIDVPPLGPRPSTPSGDWPGADFALGSHGAASEGQIVRLARSGGEPQLLGRFTISSRGSTLSFSIPRRLIGNPAWFTFSLAAARETAPTAAAGGSDFAPDRGVYRYQFSQ